MKKLLKKITLALYGWLLPKLLVRRCPNNIPRSGEEGAKINCFSVFLTKSSEPYLYFQKPKDGFFVVLEWNNGEFVKVRDVSLDEIYEFDLLIRHCWGLATIEYTNIYDFIFHRITGLIYIKVFLQRKFEAITQYFFNIRKLTTQKRIELLQFMLKDQLSRDHDGISANGILFKLYSYRWFYHPDGPQHEKMLQMHLDSLVESGDLQKINNEYVVQGKAISTIEKYEEDESRHHDRVLTAKTMVLLTLVIAIAALLQAGAIKMPTYKDFSRVIEEIPHAIEYIESQFHEMETPSQAKKDSTHKNEKTMIP